MLAFQQAIAEGRKGETVQRKSLAYNPQSNRRAEKAVQDVTDLMRRMLLGLEAKVRSRLDLTLPWSRWLVTHVAFILTRCRVGHDGLTPWRRVTGRAWNGYVFPFGEKVMGRLALKKPRADPLLAGRKNSLPGAC